MCLLILLFLLGSSFSSAEPIQDLSDRAYLPKILEQIQNAQKSIDISMYQMLLSGKEETHPVLQILRELAKAQARGVRVRILLNSRRDYDAGDTVSRVRNLAAVDFLTQNGVEVVFADSSKRVHDKLMVIDSRFVIQGSTNWTQTALLQNWESAALIDSPEYAAAMQKRIRTLPLAKNQKLDLLEDEGEMISIPSVLMTDEKYFPDMLEDKDERIFEFYMALLAHEKRGQAEIQPVPFSDQELFQRFRLNPSKGQKNNRREAVRLLKKLAVQGLIDLKIPRTGADVEITLKVPGTFQKPSERFQVPVAFFTQSWPSRLSFAAEFFYFLARLEITQSPSAPWWWRSEDYLSEKYHIHHTTLAAGMLELQRENLIEIIRDDAPEGRPHSERLANRYRVNTLESLETREEKLKRLREKFGENKFGIARSYADKIDEPNDPSVLAAILNWMKVYPSADLEAAFSQVSRYERNNPRRSLYYLKGVLEAMAR